MKIDLTQYSKKEKITTSIRIDASVHELAKKICENENVTFSDLLEALLKNFLMEEK